MQAITRKSGIPTSIWLGMLSIYVFWGSTYLAIRFAVETIPPFFMAGTRHFTAGVILYTIMRLRGTPAPTKANWRSAAIVGLLLLAGANGLVSWAEKTVPVSGDRAAGGVGAAVDDPDRLDHRTLPRQDQTAVLAGVCRRGQRICRHCAAGGPERDRRSASGPVGRRGFTDWRGAVGRRVAVLANRKPAVSAVARHRHGNDDRRLWLFCHFGADGEWGRLNLSAVSTSSVTGLIYLIVFGSLVGFASYTWLLRAAPTTLVSTYAYVNPVVAIFLGVLLADEVISPRMIVAAVIILASVALITFTRQPAKVKAVPEGSASD